MKWIGQHIWSFISRFRSDVYLEDLGTSTETNILVVDSDGKITKNTGAGDDMAFTLTGDSGSNQTIDDGSTLDIAGGNAISTVVGATDTVTVNHDDTSSQASVDNSGRTFVQDITLDTYGHVTGITSATDADTYTGDITAVVAGTGLSGGATSGSATLNVSGLTVSELAGATLITESDSIASNDNDTTLPTSAAVKLYADRPSQQIVLMRAGFKDDLGTTKHYVPLQSELEQTLYQHEMNGFVAPYSGKLLKLMYRGSGNYSGGDVAFTLEQIDRNEAFLTTPDVLETITVTGPTNNTTDPNMVTANFVGGSGTNAFVAGDHILLGMQFDTDVTASSSKHFITLVFEFDFSGVAQ